MKYTLIIAVALLYTMNAFGQQSAAGDSLTREDYLERSSKKESAAWTILGIGTAAIAGGLLISAGNNDDVNGVYSTISIGAPLVLAGVILDLISIPIFKSARKSKRRAREMEESLGLGLAPRTLQGSITPEDTSGCQKNLRVALLDSK